MNLNSKTEKLIHLYLSGDLNDMECHELSDWLRKDPQHIARFKKMTGMWHPIPDKRVDESWEIFLQKRLWRSELMKYQPKKEDNSRKSATEVLYAVTKYAAIFLLGIFISVISFRQISNSKTKQALKGIVLTETTAGQKAKVILPDSTVVWLNSETRISYSSDYLTARERIIELEGEAYFDVRDQDRNNLIVRSNDYDIHVKGTEFNVMAYADFNKTETTLVKGAVTITRGDYSLQLNPGEQGIFSGNKLSKSKAQLRQATLWKENKFYFDNVPFRELLRRLERWYDVSITLEDKSLNNEYYSGYFKNEETVWQVLDVIKMTTPIDYQRKEFREILICRK